MISSWTRRAHIYFTHTGKKEIVFVDAKTKEKRVVDVTQAVSVDAKDSADSASGINAPNGITLSPDQGTLAVSDYRGAHVWTFRVERRRHARREGAHHDVAPADRSEGRIQNGGAAALQSRERRRRDDAAMNWAAIYVATTLGVQVFDPDEPPVRRAHPSRNSTSRSRAARSAANAARIST